MSDQIDILATKLLTAEDICTRLSVSRSTFDRWRKINSLTDLSKSGLGTAGILSHVSDDSTLGLTGFPEPALHVGGSPRWDVKAVNAWLAENAHKRSRRGVGILQRD